MTKGQRRGAHHLITQDGPRGWPYLYCGARGGIDRAQDTHDREKVTCKTCLKKMKAEVAA